MTASWPLAEIDNRGKRLTGRMTCNIWWSADDKKVRLASASRYAAVKRSLYCAGRFHERHKTSITTAASALKPSLVSRHIYSNHVFHPAGHKRKTRMRIALERPVQRLLCQLFSHGTG